jgi:hypothetical protein
MTSQSTTKQPIQRLMCGENFKVTLIFVFWRSHLIELLTY